MRFHCPLFPLIFCNFVVMFPIIERAMKSSTPIITLTTDFGIRDGFPAAMHGVILSVNPIARIVDLSHGIAPGDIAHGAYVLTTVTPYFPSGSIHVAVVDPGVGTSRRILAVKTQDQVYIAPDNGLLGYVLQRHADAEVRYLENADLWLENPSFTFHGRDIMAPAAAHLSTGVPFHKVGPIADTWEPAPFPPAKQTGDRVQGHIIHIDHFGNVITNVSGETTGVLSIGARRIEGRGSTFDDGKADEPVVLAGSSGWLEIVVNRGSAARVLDASVGDIVIVQAADSS